MKSLALCAVVAAACGGKQSTPTPPGGGTAEDDPPGVVADTRTEIEKRRDTACTQLRPKITECAVEDARAELEAGRMSQQDFQANTAKAVLEKHGDEWMKECRVELSSRQVRVLEVCYREEQQCGPLLSCLQHLQPQS